ncbi:MAG: FkbM family methyltransferase [Polyangiaceae bacterium]
MTELRHAEVADDEMLSRAKQVLEVSRLIIEGIVEHPANRHGRARALGRFVGWQAWQRVAKKPITIDAFDGMKLRVHPHSTSATGVLYNRLPDFAEMSFLQRVLRPGDAFLDVGANVGIYTLFAASRIGRDGTIIAVEPGAEARERLEENVALNHLSGVRICGVAVGSSPGELVMSDDGTTTNHVLSASERSGRRVEVATLDALCEGTSPIAAKMDIEGFELEALRGAGRLLADKRPAAWILESNHCAARYDVSRADLVGLIEGAGGSVHQYDPDTGRLRGVRDDDKNILAILDRETIDRRLGG